MHRVNISLCAATLTVLIFGLWWGLYPLSAKERPGSSGIPPEKAAAYIYAVIKADRALYTTEIVNRLQAKGSPRRPSIGSKRTLSCCRPSFFSIQANWQPRVGAVSGID